MITLIVPTYNRALVLLRVIDSFYKQEHISEIIFVNDGGTDHTAKIIDEVSKKYPNIETKYIVNPSRIGAAQSRNIGVSHAKNEYVLFCDDDMYLDEKYALTCFEKMQSLNADVVSGRLIYMREGETQSCSKIRYGNGMRKGKIFWPLVCLCRNSVVFTGDQKTPMTHAVILTKKHLLTAFPYDPMYSRGNGFREESDYQINLFVNGYNIYTTNDCCTLHLPMSEVTGGGQRVPPYSRVYWSILYTKYFFDKYYAAYAKRLGQKTPKWLALTAFSAYISYKEMLRPTLYWFYLFLLSSKSQDDDDGAQTATKK